MKIAPWVGLLFVSLSWPHEPAAPLPAPAPGPRLVGRFDQRDPHGPRFGWTGSQIIARFRGGEVSVLLRDASTPEQSNSYTVVLDEGAPVKITVNRSAERYELARGLGPGPHTLTLFRNTEAFVGQTQLLGFDLGPGGALLPAPPPSARRIEIIGDSISAGYGNEGPDERCSFTAATENGYLAYGALAARLLGAEATTIAWSGRGVSRNRDAATTGTIPEIYRRTLPLSPDSAWSAPAPAADAVVINLGANDFKMGIPDEEGFLSAYAGLLAMVREHSPGAPIVCALGPTLTDAFPPGAQHLAIARRYVQKVVEQAQARGDARVHFLELDPQQQRDGYGCNYHPSLTTHRLMAERLATVVRALW